MILYLLASNPEWGQEGRAFQTLKVMPCCRGLAKPSRFRVALCDGSTLKVYLGYPYSNLEGMPCCKPHKTSKDEDITSWLEGILQWLDYQRSANGVYIIFAQLLFRSLSHQP